MLASAVLMGCSVNEESDSPEVRRVEDAREEARQIASELYDLSGLDAERTKPGPRVSLCDDKDSDTFYTINYPFSLHGVPFVELQAGMERLKKQLPAQWEIVSYGPDSSPSRSIRMVADAMQWRFSVSIRLIKAAKTRSDMLYIHLVSGCFEVPEGEKVVEY